MREARKAFQDQMLLFTLAMKEGMDESPEFQDKLAALAKYLLVQDALKSKLPSPVPTEEQLRLHFERTKDDRKSTEKATARHILVSIKKEGDAAGLTDKEALAKIEKVRKELKAKKGWPEVAKNYSDDPGSKEKGGVYENFNPAQMVPEFAEAVRTQKPGVLGEPVRTQYGYDLIEVESYTPAQTQTFEEAKPHVRVEVVNEMRTEAWTKFFESLRVELDYEELDEKDHQGAAAPASEAPAAKAPAAKTPVAKTPVAKAPAAGGKK
jgi:parvulin-like peptidyl-prolyl isomerase